MSESALLQQVPASLRDYVLPSLTLPELDYADEKQIFRHFQAYLKGIPVFNRILQVIGFATGGQSHAHSYDKPLRFNAEICFELLMQTSLEELDEAAQISGAGKKNPLYLTFLRNILAIRDGKPNQPVPSFKSDFEEDDFYLQIRSFITFLMLDTRGAPYLPLVPESYLLTRLNDIKNELALLTTSFDNLPAVQKVLTEVGTEESKALHDWLELQFSFTKFGHPHERLENMFKGTSATMVMKGIALMSEGQDQAALGCMKSALKVQIKPGRTFSSPLENFFYGLALWRCRETDDGIKQIQSLLKLKKIRESSECLPLIIILKAAIEDDASAILKSEFRYGDVMRKLTGLTVLCAKTFKLKCEIPDKWNEAFVECKCIPWFAYECEALESPSGENVLAARAELGIDPLLPIVSVKPEWEKQLEYLISLQGADAAKILGTKTDSSEKEVLTYLIDRNTLEVSLSIRKTKDDENFSKGRPAAVISLVNDRLSQASPLDRQVAETAEYGWTPTHSWGRILKGPVVIQALIDHPYVFDAADPSRRLSVKRIPLQIAVQTQKDGSYRLSSNIPTSQIKEEWPCFISDVGGDRIGVIEPTNAQRKILQSFTDRQGSATFPAEAAKKLRTLLEKLSVNTTVASDLLRDSDKIERISGDARTVFRIVPEAAGFDVTALVRPSPQLNITAKPGRGQPTLALSMEGKPVQIDRDTKKESENFSILKKKLVSIEDARESDFRWVVDTAGCLTLLSAIRDEPERAVAEWPEGETYRVSRKPIETDAMHLSSRRMGEWFEIEGTVRISADTVISVAKLLEMLKSAAGGFIRLDDKEFLELSSALRKRLTALGDAAGKKPGRSKADAVNVSVFRADVFDAIEGDDFEIDADEATRKFLSRLADAKHHDPVVPKGLKAELREYQTEGFSWMSRLASWGAGSILADDMGLGKTVQTIALLLERSKLGPQLVVMPTAVLVNWEHEIARFAPGLNVRVFNRENRAELVKSLKSGDTVLTSYGVLSSEINLLKDIEWQSVVLDEAHTVKNRATKMSKAVMMLKAECRVLLTGTPLQNRLSEIWNLFNFANPGLLGSYDDFVERFITPIEVHRDKPVQRKLKRLVSPFILRRTKAEVLDELPEKTELTIRVALTEEERALYESLRERASEGLESGEINSIQALAELTKLRQAACHPELVDPKLKLASSKTAAFIDLVTELRESGHRALVFSQFTSHLALVKRELDKLGIEYLYLDGSDSAGKRSQLVDEFQHGDTPLFLISLKAGGTGLNLTAADYVIHLDPWWNPAIEDQASDRAYRIGQDRPVTIYRLIAEGTIEEKILRLHETKKSLADALLEGTDMSSRLSRDEILKLLASD